MDTLGTRAQLTPVRVPDRARRFVIASFAPPHVSGPEVIDGHGEVVTERKAETFRQNVVIPARRAGELSLGRPRGAAITRTALENIPPGLIWQSMVARIHPGNSHVAGHSRRNRGKTVFRLLVGGGNIRFGRPTRSEERRVGKEC